MLVLDPRPRGFHLITAEVARALATLPAVEAGLAHLFLQHTSASLALGENASPEVRVDLEAFFRRSVPDGAAYFTHTEEGPDDMSAHVKAITIGASLLLPVQAGRLALGTWQGIYLGEHRTRGGARRVVLTVLGP